MNNSIDLLKNLDLKPIHILTRDINGERTTLCFNNRSQLYSILTAEHQTYLTENDEILMVIIDNMVVYSQLSNSNSLTVEDLLGFFA